MGWRPRDVKMTAGSPRRVSTGSYSKLTWYPTGACGAPPKEPTYLPECLLGRHGHSQCCSTCVPGDKMCPRHRAPRMEEGQQDIHHLILPQNQSIETQRCSSQEHKIHFSVGINRDFNMQYSLTFHIHCMSSGHELYWFWCL